MCCSVFMLFFLIVCLKLIFKFTGNGINHLIFHLYYLYVNKTNEKAVLQSQFLLCAIAMQIAK